MKKPSLLGGLALFIGMTSLSGVILSGNPAPRTRENIQNRFIGAWRLVQLDEPGADGKIHKADCTGLLVFTRDGHMSVQVMYRNAQAGGDSGPVQYAQDGYEASYGTYKIRDARTFSYHVDGALVRTLVGKDFTREYKLSGNQLIVKSPDPNEHWRVAWEQY